MCGIRTTGTDFSLNIIIYNYIYIYIYSSYICIIIVYSQCRYWYSNGCLYPDMGTVFIAIDKCDKENGCLKVSLYTTILPLGP